MGIQLRHVDSQIEAEKRMASRPPLLRRIAASLLVFVFILAAAGFLYQNIFGARDRRFNPMPGRKVNVNGSGFYMHIDCTGERASTAVKPRATVPTVVLESGLGDSYLSWRKVQAPISKFARVCSYDRAGIGYSDPSSRPRTSEIMTEELHDLLHSAGISPPYVFVGHSMGGFNVRLFAHRYPNEVAGVVLVDSSHPDQERRLPARLRNMEKAWLREAEFLEFSMPFGLPRMLDLCDDRPAVRTAECNFDTARESVEEMKNFRKSAAQVAATGSLGDLPLIVLSHDPDKPSSEMPADLAAASNRAWEKMQEELGHLSTRGSQKIVKNSSHYIQLDQPDAVVEAVRTVLDQAR
jgi:pimeloyl-ACP methyl ester carboxylesterase